MNDSLAGKTTEQKRAILKKLATVPPKDNDHLWWWFKTYLGFDIPRVQVCDDHVAPFTAVADSYFARHPIVVWEGSRGFSGKSITMAALSLCEQITLGTNIRVIGGSGEQAQRINAYIRNQDPNAHGMFWDAALAPRELLESTTKTEVRLNNGGYVKALMASPTSIRGAHPVRLRIDECDEMEQELFDASMGQTMSNRGVEAQTTISSTHHHPDGVMTELKRRARQHGFPVYQWCYKETMEPHGWLMASEVERKRREVPEAMFRNEYDLQEPSPEGRVFTDEVLENLFDKQLGEFEGEAGKNIIVVPYASDKQFFTGADFARREDFSVFHTMMRSSTGPDILAAWQRTQRLPWPVIISQFNKRLHEYQGASMHDETGIGDVISDYLTADSEGFNFSRMKESWEMFSSYVAAVEAGELAYPKIRPLYEAHRFVTVDDLFGPGHVPDEIVAAALSWRARTWATFTLQLARL